MGPANRGGYTVEEAQQFYRDRHDDDAAILLGGHLNDGLQQSQLQRGWVRRHDRGGLGELGGGLIFAVGADDPGAAFTFGLRLLGHRAFHRRGQGDVPDLDPLQPPAPRLLGGLVDDVFELGVDLLTLRQQPVHVAAPGDRPQRGLGDLGDGELVVLYVDDRLDWVDHPVVDDRVHPHRDVVAGDGVLAGHRRRGDLHVHLAQPVGDRVDPGQSRFPDAGQGAAPAENHAPLILADDLEPEHTGHPSPPGPARRLTGPGTAPARLPAPECLWPTSIITPSRHHRPRATTGSTYTATADASRARAISDID